MEELNKRNMENITEETLEKIFETLEEAGKLKDDGTLTFNIKEYWRLAVKLMSQVSVERDILPESSDRILHLRDALRLCGGLTKTTLYDLESKGLFPERFKARGYKKAIGWRLSDIQAWIADPEGWAENAKMAGMIVKDIKAK